MISYFVVDWSVFFFERALERYTILLLFTVNDRIRPRGLICQNEFKGGGLFGRGGGGGGGTKREGGL